jgi:hypothetical protein
MHYSITAITLCYILVLSHNALGLCRKVIPYKSYRSQHIEFAIATYSYRSGNILTAVALKLFLCQQAKSDKV